MNRIFPDTVLFLHFSFVLFVTAGFLFILFSYFLKLSSGRNYRFRILHLCAVVFVTVQSWLGRICPLTILETSLRSSAGEEGYRSSFMEFWLEKLIYYDLPFSFFIASYSIFLLLVVVFMFLYPPEKIRN